MSDFRNDIKNLSACLSGIGINLSVGEVIDLTDALRRGKFTFGDQPERRYLDTDTHEGRVAFALANNEVMGHMRDRKKIAAIKALRDLTNCGLKEAKDACDDDRVEQASGY